MKLLFDLLPVILFFASFKFAQGSPEASAALANAWLGGGSANDLKAADRLAPLLAAPVTAESFGPLGHFLLTEAGEPRKNLATKGLREAEPALIAWLERHR